jgi:hypothetical protein
MLLCVISGTLIVIVLYWISGTPNTHKNGFNRHIENNFITTYHFLDIGVPHYRIAGASKKQIFLTNSNNPLEIKAVDYDLNNLHSTEWFFNLPFFPANRVFSIDSPRADIFDRHSGKIHSYRIELNQPTKISEDSIHGRQFDAGLRISESKIIVRTINLPMHQHTLTKIEMPGLTATENNSVIEKQVDGYLCTDGILLYDKTTARLIYIYLYRNQFLILDSNLHLIKRARTIDTVAHSEIKIHTFKSNAVVTFETPPLTVNKKACVWRGHLYIQSGLLADNENRKTFSNNSITDVYDLKNGRYEFSFYIPHFTKYKLDEFQVYDHLLIAIQGKFIVSYLIDPRFSFEDSLALKRQQDGPAL